MAGETQEGAQQTRYLLGGGSEAERERLEAEFFADDDAFQTMLTAEDDLIDAYARGELSAAERKQFEERFLTAAEGRERVQFARAFSAAAAPRTSPVAPVAVSSYSPGFFASIFGNATALRAAFAAISIAALIGFSWLFVERSRMNTELNALRAERTRLNQQAEELQRTAEVERARSADLKAQLDARTVNPQVPGVTAAPNNESVVVRNSRREGQDIRSNDPSIGTSSRPPVDVSFEVTPGTTRGAAGNRLTIPSNATSITLRLGLERELSGQDFRALIQTPNGRAVKTLDIHTASVPRDLIQLPPIPTRELRSGDYVLFLMGKRPDNSFSNVASYSFRVGKN